MRCIRKQKFFLKHKTIPGRSMLVDLRCGCWNCPSCAERLRGVWTKNLGRHFREAGQLYCWTGTVGHWSSHVYKQIQRLGCNYVRVVKAAGSVVVITDADIGNSLPIKDAVSAIFLFADAIARPRDRKPVSTSRGWKRPVESKASEWTPVAKTRLGLDEARAVLREMGISSHRFDGAASIGLLWKAPPDLDEEVTRRLLEYALSEHYFWKKSRSRNEGDGAVASGFSDNEPPRALTPVAAPGPDIPHFVGFPALAG